MTGPVNGTRQPVSSPWDDQGPCAGGCGARITRYGRKANGTLCPACRDNQGLSPLPTSD